MWAWATPTSHHLSWVAAGELAFHHDQRQLLQSMAIPPWMHLILSKTASFSACTGRGLCSPETPSRLFSWFSDTFSKRCHTPTPPGPCPPISTLTTTAKVPISGKGGSHSRKVYEQMSLDAFTLRRHSGPPSWFLSDLVLPGFVTSKSLQPLSEGEISVLKDILFSSPWVFTDPIKSFLWGKTSTVKACTQAFIAGASVKAKSCEHPNLLQ